VCPFHIVFFGTCLTSSLCALLLNPTASVGQFVFRSPYDFDEIRYSHTVIFGEYGQKKVFRSASLESAARRSLRRKHSRKGAEQFHTSFKDISR
jgi:hypothetical protein